MKLLLLFWEKVETKQKGYKARNLYSGMTYLNELDFLTKVKNKYMMDV